MKRTYSNERCLLPQNGEIDVKILCSQLVRLTIEIGTFEAVAPGIITRLFNHKVPETQNNTLLNLAVLTTNYSRNSIIRPPVIRIRDYPDYRLIILKLPTSRIYAT